MPANQPQPYKQILRKIEANLPKNPQQAIILYEQTDWSAVSQRASKFHQRIREHINTLRKQLTTQTNHELNPLLQDRRYIAAQSFIQSIYSTTVKAQAQASLTQAITSFEQQQLSLLAQKEFQQFYASLQNAQIDQSLLSSLDKALNRAISELQTDIDQKLKKYQFKVAADNLAEAKLPTKAHSRLIKKITQAQSAYTKQITDKINAFQFVTASKLLEACQLNTTEQQLFERAITQATEAKLAEINLLMTEFQFTQIHALLSKIEFDQATTSFLISAIWAAKAKQLELFDSALSCHDFITSQTILRNLGLCRENDRYQAWRTQLAATESHIQQCLIVADFKKNVSVFGLLKMYKLPQHSHESLYEKALTTTKKIIITLLESTPCNFKQALSLIDTPHIPSELLKQLSLNIADFQKHYNEQFQHLLKTRHFTDAAHLISYELILPQADYDVLLNQLHQAQSLFIANVHREVLAQQFEDFSIIAVPMAPNQESDDEFELLEPHTEILTQLHDMIDTKQFYAVTAQDQEKLTDIKATYPDHFVDAVTETSAITTAGLFAGNQAPLSAAACKQPMCEI